MPRLACPACRAPLIVPRDTSPARKIRCPGCGEIFSMAASRSHVTPDEKSALQLSQWHRFAPADQKSSPDKEKPIAPLAWEQSGGSLFSLWQSCWQVLLRPWQIFQPAKGPGLARPFWFSVCLLLIGILPWAGNEILGYGSGWTWLALAGGLLMGPLAGALFIMAAALVQHGLLGVIGARRGSWRDTYGVMAYGQSFHLLSLLIWLGFVAASLMLDHEEARIHLLLRALPWVWGFWVLTLGLKACRRISFIRVFALLFLEALVAASLLAILWELGPDLINSLFA